MKEEGTLIKRKQRHLNQDYVTVNRSLKYANGRTKRLFDLTAGVALSIITAPVILILALGSAVSYRAWPLFVQDRMGRGGHTFRFIKVRSLPTSTVPTADKYEIAGQQFTLGPGPSRHPPR